MLRTREVAHGLVVNLLPVPNLSFIPDPAKLPEHCQMEMRRPSSIAQYGLVDPEATAKVALGMTASAAPHPRALTQNHLAQFSRYFQK